MQRMNPAVVLLLTAIILGLLELELARGKRIMRASQVFHGRLQGTDNYINIYNLFLEEVPKARVQQGGPGRRNAYKGLRICRYDEGDRQICEKYDRVTTLIRNVLPSSESHCPESIKEKQLCDSADQDSLKGLHTQKSRCEYSSSQWSQCTDNRHSIELTLMRGARDVCKPSVIMTSLCTRHCQYSRTIRYPCGRRGTRVLAKILMHPSHRDCPGLISWIMKCGSSYSMNDNSTCQYAIGRWSSCVGTLRVRTIHLTLEKGDARFCLKNVKRHKYCGARKGRRRQHAARKGRRGQHAAVRKGRRQPNYARKSRR